MFWTVRGRAKLILRMAALIIALMGGPVNAQDVSHCESILKTMLGQQWGVTETRIWKQICEFHKLGKSGAHLVPAELNHLSSSFVAQILTDESTSKYIPRQGIAFVNFHITGDLDLSFIELAKPIRFERCRFGEINLTSSRFSEEFVLLDSRINRRFLAPEASFGKLILANNLIVDLINLANSSIDGDVTDLRGNQTGFIFLNGADVSGELFLSETRLIPSRTAKLGIGKIDLIAANIGRNLFKIN
jgi:hypothetical protein